MSDSPVTPPAPGRARLPRSEIALRFAIALSALLVVALVGLMLIIAFRGELAWRRNELSSDRVFLIMDRRQRGLGWERVGRLNSVPTDAPTMTGLVCSETSVRYFLWEGDASDQNATYCECYQQTED